MKKKKVKLNFKRIFLLIIILVILILISLFFSMYNKNSINTIKDYFSYSSKTSNNYPIIKLDDNPNYSGIRSKKS